MRLKSQLLTIDVRWPATALLGILWMSWIWCLWTPMATAGTLGDRAARFPNWQAKPPVRVARGDLAYPQWMAGHWEVTSTLVEAIAPLAPTLVTPGFESNRRYLDRALHFRVRFDAPVEAPSEVVADRVYNGLEIAKAYLGENKGISVSIDPTNPNRQVTTLPPNRQLVSVVKGRGSERPNVDRFVATEIAYQIFRTRPQIYFNEVETTTAYERRSPMRVEAEQMTAVYLSPQDPNYFQANGRPVALYRYHLQLDRDPMSLQPST